MSGPPPLAVPLGDADCREDDVEFGLEVLLSLPRAIFRYDIKTI